MSPDDWIKVASYGSFFAGVATVVVLLIQLLAWPDDRQKVSAMVMVIASSAFIWRVWVAIAFGVAMKDNPSAILYVLMTVGWVWFMAETIALNWGRFRYRVRHWRDHPFVVWCCRRREGSR